MRAPAFWWETSPSLLAQCLRPAGALYGAVASRRMGRAGDRAALPVICIGNFTVGGAGKTPTALAVARLLREAGERPAFLTRGYGGRLAGPVRVEAHHEAADVGDEPLLLARAAPTIVSRDRVAGARLAAELGASVVVMDDGLQNPSLHKDMALAVVDGATGLGNALPFPSGPLRAPMGRQWAAAHAVLIIGPGEPGGAVARAAQARAKPVFQGRLVPDPDAEARLRGIPVLAFAGIGRPGKFFETLRDAGADLVEARAFPDHHPYTAQDLAALAGDAAQRNLTLVTTEKDLARLGPDLRQSAHGIVALPISLAIEAEDSFRALVQGVVQRRL